MIDARMIDVRMPAKTHLSLSEASTSELRRRVSPARSQSQPSSSPSVLFLGDQAEKEHENANA